MSTHKHAVAAIENHFGKRITSILRTYPTEEQARRKVRNDDKGTFPTRILSGQAYARLEQGEWLLDDETISNH